jgi:hypothetical protein
MAVCTVLCAAFRETSFISSATTTGMARLARIFSAEMNTVL